MNCESCGMPMNKSIDFGGARKDNKYCRYCTDAKGELKSREEIRKGMTNFIMKSSGKSRIEAEKETDIIMSKMIAWKK